MAVLNFDICILGGGFSGLLVARQLKEKGLSVALVEKSDRLGGRLFSAQSPVGPVSRDFGLFPAAAESESLFPILNSFFDNTPPLQTSTLPPLTYSKGNLQTFVGFGDHAPGFVDELAPFLGSERIDSGWTWSELVNKLVEPLKAEVFLSTKATAFNFEGDRVLSLSLEDGRSISAKEFVYAGNDSRWLLTKVPNEHYSQRELQKLLKTPTWSAVQLDVVHEGSVTDSLNVHVLTGTTKESIPCIGAFEPTRTLNGKTFQVSHWATYFSPESEDEEGAALALRELRRQIKRAYPDAWNGIIFEKLTVEEGFGRIELKTEPNGRWPDLQNLWIATSDASPQNGVLGAASQALMVAQVLGSSGTSISAEFTDAPSL